MTRKISILSLLLISTFSVSISSAVIAASDENLTVYSTRKEHLIKPLFDAFTAKTGIKVAYLTGKGGALIERIKLEGKRTKADIFMTVDAGNLWYASTQNLFQAVIVNSLKVIFLLTLEIQTASGRDCLLEQGL